MKKSISPKGGRITLLNRDGKAPLPFNGHQKEFKEPIFRMGSEKYMAQSLRLKNRPNNGPRSLTLSAEVIIYERKLLERTGAFKSLQDHSCMINPKDGAICGTPLSLSLFADSLLTDERPGKALGVKMPSVYNSRLGGVQELRKAFNADVNAIQDQNWYVCEPIVNSDGYSDFEFKTVGEYLQQHNYPLPETYYDKNTIDDFTRLNLKPLPNVARLAYRPCDVTGYSRRELSGIYVNAHVANKPIIMPTNIAKEMFPEPELEAEIDNAAKSGYVAFQGKYHFSSAKTKNYKFTKPTECGVSLPDPPKDRSKDTRLDNLVGSSDDNPNYTDNFSQ